MVMKAVHMKQGDLPGGRDGVHALLEGRRAGRAGVRATV